MLTIGLGLVIQPAAVDLCVYAALGILVGAMKAWAQRRVSSRSVRFGAWHVRAARRPRVSP